jgi:hydrogenase expression/formation protein HypC
MCLAIPMRITAIDGTMATIEIDGLTQRASLMLVPDAEIGDYVLVHAGCAISVMTEDDAQETLRLLAEISEFEMAADDAVAGERPDDGGG